MTENPSISIVIPTYCRGKALADTLEHLAALDPAPAEVLIMDQTPAYPNEISQRLGTLLSAAPNVWERLSEPSIPAAMNEGLKRARSDYVLFLDDDVIPSKGLLLCHLQAYGEGVGAVTGQVLQPGENPVSPPERSRGEGLRKDLNFCFHQDQPDEVCNVMAGNLSVKREAALSIGGFDEQFDGTAYRFETDFARRLTGAGYTIRFEPSASIHHLRLAAGGTRSKGDHLQKPSPRHSCGDYYFSFLHGRGAEGFRYRLHRLIRSVLNRFHLTHPWRIPVTLCAEFRGWKNAAERYSVFQASSDLLRPLRLTFIETHPIQYKAPLFRCLASDERLNVQILYAMIPDARTQGEGFGTSFTWDVPLLDGYPYRVLQNVAAVPSATTFSGCDTPEIYAVLREARPDAVLVNGWVAKTCLQTLWACRRLGIPCLVRGEANRLRPRVWWKHALHRLLLAQYQGWLAIGSANRAFYRSHGCREERIFNAAYAVDNAFFTEQARLRASRVEALRTELGVPTDVTVFLFVGKLEGKKRPQDLVQAIASWPMERRAKAYVLMVGDGPLREDLERLAREADVPCTFTGFVNQTRLPDVYAAADVLVLPSDAGETWGLVVNEAMASGLPAVVSQSVGCVEDLILDGKTGFSFDCGDVEALSEHLSRFVDEEGLAARLGKQAAIRISDFSFAQVVDGVVEAVQAVTRSGKGASCFI